MMALFCLSIHASHVTASQQVQYEDPESKVINTFHLCLRFSYLHVRMFSVIEGQCFGKHLKKMSKVRRQCVRDLTKFR